MPALYNRTNVVVAPLSDGWFRLSKAGGSPASFDASAASEAAIAGDFVLEARVSSGSAQIAVGVTVDPAEGDDAATIDRAIVIDGATMTVQEDGVVRTAAMAHGGGVWILRTAGVLSYRCGATLGGSTLQRSVEGVLGALFFDSSIATLGATIDVRFAPPARARAERVHLATGLAL